MKGLSISTHIHTHTYITYHTHIKYIDTDNSVVLARGKGVGGRWQRRTMRTETACGGGHTVHGWCFLGLYT